MPFHESSLTMDTRRTSSTCTAVTIFCWLSDKLGTRFYGFIHITHQRRSFGDCWSGVLMMQQWCMMGHYLGTFMTEMFLFLFFESNILSFGVVDPMWGILFATAGGLLLSCLSFI